MMKTEERKEWNATVATLDYRAKYGITAQKLIKSAEDMSSSYEAKIEHLEYQIEELKADHREDLKVKQDRVESLEKSNESLESELKQIKTLKVNPYVEDADAKFVFKPRADSQDYRESYFTIEHLDEILMYLRMNGADDSTPVAYSSSGISSVVTGVGYVMPTPKPQEENKKPEEESKIGVIHRLWISTKKHWSILFVGLAALYLIGDLVVF